MHVLTAVSEKGEKELLQFFKQKEAKQLCPAFSQEAFYLSILEGIIQCLQLLLYLQETSPIGL